MYVRTASNLEAAIVDVVVAMVAVAVDAVVEVQVASCLLEIFPMTLLGKISRIFSGSPVMWSVRKLWRHQMVERKGLVQCDSIKVRMRKTPSAS